MRRNYTVRNTMRRKNIFFDKLFRPVKGLSRYARLMLECIIRKNFGYRYYSFASCLTVLAFLILFPIFWEKAASWYANLLGEFYYDQVRGSLFIAYWSWYAFAALFLLCAIRRLREVSRPVPEFDSSEFSLSMGQIHEMFYRIKLFGKEPSPRRIEIIYEPAFFLLIGIVLSLLNQPVGPLLIVSSVLYSFSYIDAYKGGDELVARIGDGKHTNQLRREIYGNVPNSQPGEFSRKRPRPNPFGSGGNQHSSEDDETTMVE